MCNTYDDVVYIGRVRTCGREVIFGRCCKAKLVKQFGTLGKAGIALAKLHTIACDNRRSRLHDDGPLVVDITQGGEIDYPKNPMAN